MGPVREADGEATRGDRLQRGLRRKRKYVDKIHWTGKTTLRCSVKGRKLTLRWLKTNEPPYRGIPDKVFQYALYMTAHLHAGALERAEHERSDSGRAARLLQKHTSESSPGWK